MDKRAEGERLRAKIDQGRMADKVKVSDPAAVPLPGDAESAGTPTPPGETARSAKRQQKIADVIFQHGRTKIRRRDWWVFGALAVLIVAGIAMGVASWP